MTRKDIFYSEEKTKERTGAAKKEQKKEKVQRLFNTSALNCALHSQLTADSSSLICGLLRTLPRYGGEAAPRDFRLIPYLHYPKTKTKYSD